MSNMKHAIVHVADIHYRPEAPEGASSIMKALLIDLKEQIERLSEYKFFIAFTGDIAQAGGQPGVYDTFAQGIDLRLSEMGLARDTRIVVPGNHDLDRDLVDGFLQEYRDIHKKSSITETAFNDFMSTPNELHAKFDNYAAFLASFAEHDDELCRTGWGRQIADDVSVYCLNSALCSFGGLDDINDEGQLAIYTRGLVDWCNNKTTTNNILLLHHPLDHLNTWSRVELETIIEKHFTICLCGHNHRPEVYHRRIPESGLICTAPPLFCGKDTTLAYSILLLEDGQPTSLVYREYSGGQFLPGTRISKTDDGVVKLGTAYVRYLREMEASLQAALNSFKGQPNVFVEPTIAESREFNDAPNLLRNTIESPRDTMIVAPPQFGLTCLSLYMRLEAYRQKKFWIYIDGTHMKARNIQKFIQMEAQHYDKDATDVECIMIDGWDSNVQDHRNMLQQIHEAHPDVPILLYTIDRAFLETTYTLSKVDRTFGVLHLQALRRNAMRQLVSGYNSSKQVVNEDDLHAQIATHMEAINIHRTPLNCLTLLRVLDSNYSEKLLNKTKLMKAILFVLFTDYESFSHASKSIDVDECTFVLGCYCKQLVVQGTRSFDSRKFVEAIKTICKDRLISLDVDTMVSVLLENNILVQYDSYFEFKHRCWIFFFAANYMLHDDEFMSYILEQQRYVNFPEIIDFLAGIDGKQEDALKALLTDLKRLIEEVDTKIGIEGTFNPLSTLLWNPSGEFVEKTRRQIAEKVESSNLPAAIKDKQADEHYDSAAPYDQSISRFLNEYSVVSLNHSIRAVSRALRNSALVKPELKLEVAEVILNGWEQISKVFFWLSPLLAREGKAVHGGYYVVLSDGFSENISERFRQILVSNPANVVGRLKDDLASNKVGLLLNEQLITNESHLQKHFVAMFLITVRPEGWFNPLLDHLNRLHPRSFYLGNLLTVLEHEVRLGFLKGRDEAMLKQLVGAVLAKRRCLPKSSARQRKPIPASSLLCDNNKLPIDKLLAKQGLSGRS